jgi:Fe-S oxidoreductase
MDKGGLRRMNQLIDENMVELIRSSGNTFEHTPERKGILEENSLPYDRPAENVIVTGCQLLALLPDVLRTLARLYDRAGFSYTFLSREYCCGNYLYRPAIAARDDAAMAECRELSRDFVALNIEAMKDLGAERLVIFCSPCYPIYKHAFPEEDIVFYPATLSEIMDEVSYDGRIDYYAGCYRLHRRFAPVPMDLESTEKVFAKIKGLDIHRISAPKCCYKPEGAAHMMENVETDTMVHICTGCYGQALANLPEGGGTEVLMLPEFVEKVLSK